MELRPPPGARACLELVEGIRKNLSSVAADWVSAGTRAKGLPHGHSEEWLVGPVPLARYLRLTSETLARVEAGRPVLPVDCITTSADGRTRVRVLPNDARDGLLFRDFSADVYLKAETDPDAVLDRAASAHRRGRSEGACLVLGAGNVSSIPAIDVLSKVFGEGRPVILKPSPVNDWVVPYLERALAPLIEDRHLAIVRGGADVGADLMASDAVEAVHLTGSIHTHDRIVWGEDVDAGKAGGRPVLNKPITSELGNISPIVVAPGTYGAAELEFLASSLAASVTNNVGFNCNATRLIVVAAGWHQKNGLLSRLEQKLLATPVRKAYYPGAEAEYAAATEGKDVVTFGRREEGVLPWTLLRGLDAASNGEPFFRREHFCPVVGWLELSASDSLDFLRTATEFLNERLWGTLNAGLVVPASEMRSATVSDEVEDALHRLRYGTVALNHWPALGYAWGSPPWGGAPGATLADAQSGLGWVHNAHMLEGAEKTIIRGPMPCWPKPIWFNDHRGATDAARNLMAYEGGGGWWSVARTAVPAVFG